MKTNHNSGGDLVDRSLPANTISTAACTADERSAQFDPHERHVHYIRHHVPSRVGVNTVLLHHLELMAEYRPQIAVDEVILLLNATNNGPILLMTEPSQVRGCIVAEVEDWQYYYGEPGDDFSDFITRLKQMTTVEACSLASSIDQWWGAPDSERSTEAAALSRYFNLRRCSHSAGDPSSSAD